MVATATQCQSYDSVTHVRCGNAPEVECRDYADPAFVIYTCESCAQVMKFNEFPKQAYGDPWPKVSGRAYRRIQ